MLKNSFEKINRQIGYAIAEIAVPESELLCWNQDETQRYQYIKAAETNKLTFLPVKSRDRIEGIIHIEKLRAGERYDDLTQGWILDVNTPILELISLFDSIPDHVYLVSHSDSIVGLVAPADLNKLAARASVYLLVASFEMRLTDLIKRTIGEDEQAFSSILSSDRLAKIEQQRREARKDDLELGLIHYLFLEDLVTIVAKNEQLRTIFGFNSRGETEKQLSFKSVRNPVSHGNNLLIKSRRDLESVNDACQRLIEYSNKIAAWENVR